jgi:hypothetical protein
VPHQVNYLLKKESGWPFPSIAKANANLLKYLVSEGDNFGSK